MVAVGKLRRYESYRFGVEFPLLHTHKRHPGLPGNQTQGLAFRTETHPHQYIGKRLAGVTVYGNNLPKLIISQAGGFIGYLRRHNSPTAEADRICFALIAILEGHLR